MSELQQTPEWFEQRKHRVTGSVAGAILNLSPYMKSSDVMRSMVRAYHGAPTEFEGNIATQHGTFHERFAIMDYEAESGNKVTSCGFYPYLDWLGASPDGLVDDDGLVEVKCPYGARETGIFKDLIDQPHYEVQMQLEMLSADRKWCDFYQWSSVNTKCQRVMRRDITFELGELREFYEEYLEAIKSPDKYLSDAITTKEAMALSAAYVKAYNEKAEAESKMDEIKARLIELAGNEKTTIGDLLVYPVEKKGSVSYAKAIAELLPDADLSKWRGKPSTSWVVKC